MVAFILVCADKREFKMIKKLLAWIMPPLSLLISSGCLISCLLNLFLTICGWIPGVIHAFYWLSLEKTNWRDLPPTENQIDYARDLGIKFKASKVTRGSLSDMITKVTGR